MLVREERERERERGREGEGGKEGEREVGGEGRRYNLLYVSYISI